MRACPSTHLGHALLALEAVWRAALHPGDDLRPMGFQRTNQRLMSPTMLLHAEGQVFILHDDELSRLAFCDAPTN